MRVLLHPLPLFTVLVIFLCLILSGCSETPAPVTPDTDRTLDMMEGQSYPISMQEGLTKMAALFSDEEKDTRSIPPVFFLQAQRIDTEGKAAKWIFGIKEDNENIFVIVQSDKQILAPYPGDLPESEISFTRLVDPAALIGKNRELFIKSGAREPLILPELELSKGIYTVTVSTRLGTTVMVFNSSTGNQITIRKK